MKKIVLESICLLLCVASFVIATPKRSGAKMMTAVDSTQCAQSKSDKRNLIDIPAIAWGQLAKPPLKPAETTLAQQELTNREDSFAMKSVVDILNVVPVLPVVIAMSFIATFGLIHLLWWRHLLARENTSPMRNGSGPPEENVHQHENPQLHAGKFHAAAASVNKQLKPVAGSKSEFLQVARQFQRGKGELQLAMNLTRGACGEALRNRLHLLVSQCASVTDVLSTARRYGIGKGEVQFLMQLHQFNTLKIQEGMAL
jgi:hypothetical protein